MGLTLRKLDKEGKDLRALQEKILKKYDTNGLRVAHFVQNGLFSKYVGNILERAITSQKLTFEIENLFQNIDKTVAFIQSKDEGRTEEKINEIVAKIRVNSPETFVISSSGSAMEACEIIIHGVMSMISGYTLENYNAESRMRKIFFLNKEEEEQED